VCLGKLVCDKAQNKCVIDPTTVIKCAPSTNPCVKNECAPSTGKCVPDPVAAGACDDGDICTQGDACVGGVCKAGTSVCECKTDTDCAGKTKNLCAGTFACKSNKCVLNPGSAVVCAKAGDTACSKNTCVPTTGKCVMQAAPDGAICQTKAPCSVAGKCKAGKCAPPPAGVCDDGNPCTDDTCHAGTGKCVSTPVNDGTPCGAGQCKAGACSGGQKVSIKADADADSWLEGNSNRGKANLLILGKSGSYAHKRSVVRFNLSGLPKGAKIAAARMRVFVAYWHDSKGGKDTPIDRTIAVHRMLRAWTEYGITTKNTGAGGPHKYWQASYVALNDFDAAKAPAITALWTKGSGGWKDFDITQLVQAWADDPAKNFGVLLRATNETQTGREPRMHSREAGGGNASLGPHVVIDYFKK